MAVSLLCIIIPIMILVFIVYFVAYDRGYKAGQERSMHDFAWMDYDQEDF